MPLIGNTLGGLRYVDLPITAGSAPSVTYTTDRVLDLVGIDILAAGATAAALKVDGTVVAGGAIASFSGNKGSKWASQPSGGVPAYNGSNGAAQSNQNQGAGLYANMQSSGTVQSGITDRNGSVPNQGSLTPISAAIPSGKVVEVDLTGTVTVLQSLPAADGSGFIVMPSGNSQAGFTNMPADSIPFKVKASDTLADTFAGIVRLVFQVPVSDPNTTAKSAGTYPNNGIQRGSTY
jgi:hypothetical protein